MDHRDIKELLSAYIDGALTLEEKGRVEGHLKGCNECSGTLAQLREAVSRIRSLNEVEPPPFLSRKIMKEIRKETRHPLRKWIPLEAAAMIAVAFTSFYIYKTFQPPLVTEAPKEITAPEALTETPAPEEPKKLAQKSEEPGIAGRRARAPQAPAVVGRAAPAPAAAPSAAEMPAMKAGPMAAAPPAAEMPPAVAMREEAPDQKTSAGARAMRMKAASLEKEPREVRLTLVVEDLDAASKRVEEILHQAGATQIKTESFKDKKIYTTLLRSQQLSMVLEKLKPLGEIKGGEPVPAPEEPSVMVIIKFEQKH